MTRYNFSIAFSSWWTNEGKIDPTEDSVFFHKFLYRYKIILNRDAFKKILDQTRIDF